MYYYYKYPKYEYNNYTSFKLTFYAINSTISNGFFIFTVILSTYVKIVWLRLTVK